MSLLDTASLIVTPNGYKEGKLYSVIPSDGSGDMSVTRATTATRVNSAGLVELVPYNLLQYSENYSDTSWIKSNVSVTSNSTTAPDGTTTADTITDTASGGLLLQVSTGTNASAVVTQSFYFKKSNTNWVYIGISRSGSTTYGEVVKFFNLNTGAIGSTVTYGAGVFVDANIQDAGNGWYRCSLTASVPNALGYAPYFGNANADGAPFVSDIGDATFIWGAQSVEGSTAKDYQKTETRLNIPRLDYSNGTCPSLLVEPQRTNLALYSSSFDNAAWTKYQASITANNTTDPSGVLSADKFLDSTANDIHATYAGFLISSATTISAYVKSAEYTRVAISNLSDGGDVIFNLADGTIVSTSGNFVNSQIESFDNGWYRISATTNGTSGFKAIGYSLVNNSNQTSFAGTGTSGLFIWGAQVEVGSYSTSYIPTTSASVTRNADVISKTGISSLIGQTEGTLFVDFNYYGNINAPATFEAIPLNVGNGTFSNSIYFTVFQSTLYLVVWSGGVNQATITLGAVTQGRYKAAVTYINNDVKAYLNGTLAGSDTSVTLPTLSGVYLGAAGTSTTPEAHSTNAAALWKTRLTNTQLAQLTTI
jgi:hypothetical protein